MTKRKRNRQTRGKEKDRREVVASLSNLIDPITTPLIQLVKLVILLVPLILFVAYIYLLSGSWQIISSQPDLESLFVGNSRDNMILYVASYVISAIFFICGYWRMIRELRSYSKE